MNAFRNTLLCLVLALAAIGAIPGAVQACPSCQAALDNSAGAEGNDPLQEAKAYALSIYLMAGMPYLMLTVGGLVMYRAVKRAEKKNLPTTPDSLPT